MRQQNDHRRGDTAAVITKPLSRGLALARLEARIGLVDDVNAPLAPHEAIVAMAFLERFQ
jgi:hypothetical protein